jgi:hypothetical protein
MPGGALDAGPFRGPVLAWLVGVAATSLVLAVAFSIVPPEGGVAVESAGADAFSRSALGHRAFVELLRATGVPVVVSRHASAERARGHALLVLAEPRLEGGDSPRRRRMEAMLRASGNALLVLPKWEGTGRSTPRGWLESVSLLPELEADRVLHAARVEGAVFRKQEGGPTRCQGTGRPWTSRAPQLFMPTPSAASTALRPVIRCGSGILLAEVHTSHGGRLMVLSDPDVLENHGIGKDENARFALDVLARARQGGQAVVFDETLHGHERVPSLWRDLFTFPLLPSVLQAALALAALVWSGLARFGAPLPAPSPHGSGRSVLIENIASLLRSAGHSAHTLGRYLDASVEDVARGLQAPAARRAELRGWLDRVGRLRGAQVELGSLEAQVQKTRRSDNPTAASIVSAARRIHRWRQEMLHGPQDNPGRPGTPPRRGASGDRRP